MKESGKRMERTKLVIVDGHNLLFQMFYGMPNRILNKDGKAIQGTLGFVGALIKIIKQTEPTHLLVLFDSEHENPRTEVLEEYKANRPDFSKVPDEENPFCQLPDVYKALDYMGIRHQEVEEMETDDVIASYVYAYEKSTDIVVVSWDSDFFQLIGPNVKVLRYRGKNSVWCDEGFLKDKFDIVPKQYAGFKALVGDKADNIKGVNKIGIKTAAALLQQFGSLEQILKNVEQIAKKAVRESLMTSIEQVHTNYRLIKLDGSAKRPFEWEKLTYKYDGKTTNQILEGIGVK